MKQDTSSHLRERSDLSGVSNVFLDNFSYLKKFLARYLSKSQDIEDVVQETYLRAFNAEQGKAIEKPKAFLFRIAKNIALTELSKKGRQITDYIEDVDAKAVNKEFVNVEDEVEAEQSIGLYCEAVASLPERRRRVYLLRKVHGLSHKEIADRLSVSPSTVDKHLSKALLACRAYIKEREDGKLARGKEADLKMIFQEDDL